DMGKTKGFLSAIQHREILMTDLGLVIWCFVVIVIVRNRASNRSTFPENIYICDICKVGEWQQFGIKPGGECA
ncbi:MULTISPECIES: hypothetical protein, partial [unclassified Bacteroides]|uniref:hypothetical protein n=1 Tax=unclassified Bacteroides TaxID=2646097 RepID=UPI00054FC803